MLDANFISQFEVPGGRQDDVSCVHSDAYRDTIVVKFEDCTYDVPRFPQFRFHSIMVMSTVVDGVSPDRVRKKFKTPGGRAKEAVMAEKSIPSFEHLSAAADSLNKATDELKQVIDNLDVAIRKLNVGVSAWVEVQRWAEEDDPQSYQVEQVGYSKQGGTWRLSIRHLVGHEQNPGPDKVREVWAFNNAPRALRLRAIEKLPHVLETLAKQLNQQTAIVNKKLTEAKLFTIGIGLEVPKVPK